ncbi:Gfo/Idh/MocA family protein, partial [Candidatus Hydrogenedentota bacterium]
TGRRSVSHNVAMMDVNEENMCKVADEFCTPKGNEPRFYTDFGKMIADEDMDGVAMATPHNMHFPQATHALENELHVLLEKPMVTSTSDAEALVKTVEESGKKLLIAFPGASSREHRHIRDLRESGELGEIRNFTAKVAQKWAEGREDQWRQKPEISGGGQLYDSGSHVINATLWLTDLRPVEVYADVNKRGFAVDVTTGVIIKFENGGIGVLTIIGDSTGPFEHAIEMYTDKCTIQVGVFGMFYDQWNGTEKVDSPGLPTDESTCWTNFVNSVLGKEEILCGPKYGLRLAKLMDALYESGETGVPVKITY